MEKKRKQPELVAQEYWLKFRKNYLRTTLAKKISQKQKKHFSFLVKVFDKLPQDSPLCYLQEIIINYTFPGWQINALWSTEQRKKFKNIFLMLIPLSLMTLYTRFCFLWVYWRKRI